MAAFIGLFEIRILIFRITITLILYLILIGFSTDCMV